ncbi:MAG: hypothetical protein M1821_004668 [Bathelium mastoideum]|nr:MAG: hypothetical protein M1821_004668 [Bathelium mastoideum]KAI9674641.1 MAG: hypothetical protein M1822_009045 [Bathelium mastoideum]
MCLIHDLGESLVGDITPADNVPRLEKYKREHLTVEYIKNTLLCSGGFGEAILSIWQEHEDGITLESKVVQDIDKLELLLQMMEYERRGRGRLDLSEFARVSTKIELPEMQAWAKHVLDERKAFWYTYGITVEDTIVSLQTKKMQDQYYDKDSHEGSGHSTIDNTAVEK